MGQVMAMKAVAFMLAYGGIWMLMGQLDVSYKTMYLLAGGVGMAVSTGIWSYFPRFKPAVARNTRLIMRSRYWLYYALIFMNGARRHIFMYSPLL